MAWIQSTAPTTLKRTRDGHLKPTDLILKQEQELKLLIEPFTTTLCFGLAKEYLPQQISSAQLSKLFIRKANIHTSMLLAYRVLTRTFMLASAIWDRYIQEVMVVVDTKETTPIKLQQFDALAGASFLIACKVVETNAPSVFDIKVFFHDRARMSTILEAESHILHVLHFDVSIVTAVDVVDKLCSFAHETVGKQIHPTVQNSLEVTCCEQNFNIYSVADLAVGVMLYACSKQNIPDEQLNFIPKFMFTGSALQCKQDLFDFITTVMSSIEQKKEKS